MKSKDKVLFALSLFLTILSLNTFAQKTFTINKNATDSIVLKNYKIFSLSENLDINFIGKQIPKSKRFKLTKEQAMTANSEFRKQYVKAGIQQYYKQLNDPEQFSDSLELDKSKISYKKTIKKFKANVIKDQRTKLNNYDRYFFGYFNEYNEKLILMRFDPHRIKYFAVPGAGESLVDVLTIYVFNLDKNVLSMSGWADFKE